MWRIWIAIWLMSTMTNCDYVVTGSLLGFTTFNMHPRNHLEMNGYVTNRYDDGDRLYVRDIVKFVQLV